MHPLEANREYKLKREFSTAKKSLPFVLHFYNSLHFYFLQISLITFYILLHIKSLSKYLKKYQSSNSLQSPSTFHEEELWSSSGSGSPQPSHRGRRWGGGGGALGNAFHQIPATQSVVEAPLGAGGKCTIRPHCRPTGAELHIIKIPGWSVCVLTLRSNELDDLQGTTGSNLLWWRWRNQQTVTEHLMGAWHCAKSWEEHRDDSDLSPFSWGFSSWKPGSSNELVPQELVICSIRNLLSYSLETAHVKEKCK